MNNIKMKKLEKIFSIVLLTTMIVSSIVVSVEAAVNPTTISKGEIETTQITTIGGQIVTIVSVVGSVVSVIILVVLGLKYMMGSAEEKAEYKKTLMPYVIGAILVFAASALAGMIFEFASGIKGTT